MVGVKKHKTMSLTFDDIRAVGALLDLKYPGLLQDSKVNQWTVAHFIAAFGTAEQIVALHSTSPHLFQAVTLNGMTPFQIALEHGNVSTAVAILHFLFNW